jgi:pyruvate dehydrogenase E2 component (dihydrolipoamide acetyltransferase)
MHEIDVPMPKMSMTMEEGELIAWRVEQGTQVRAGDVICEVMSDKVEMEVESPADGTLVRLVAGEGDTVAVGAPIATLATEAEDLLGDLFGAPAEEAAAPAPEAPAPAPAAAAGNGHGAAPAPAAPEAPSGPRPVVPAARRRAKELGVDLAAVTGSGPDGLVRVADVEGAGAPAAAAAAPAQPKPEPQPEPGGAAAAATVRPAPAPPPAPAAPAAARPSADAPSGDGRYDEIPLTPMRKVVAKRLTESMQQAPHFYLGVVVDAEELLALRARLNDELAGDGIKLSVNDLLVKACAAALRAHPGINVSFAGDKILQHHDVNIGIAVALDAGLIVPVVHDADAKSLGRISSESRELIGKAREGKLGGPDLKGGTFTISNLGMFGIDQFTAVINPPEAAILAVGATTRSVVEHEGEVTVRSTMRLTLSIDHRALDGATAAAFLATLRGLLEAPYRLLA